MKGEERKWTRVNKKNNIVWHYLEPYEAYPDERALIRQNLDCYHVCRVNNVFTVGSNDDDVKILMGPFQTLAAAKVAYILHFGVS